jgi:predicted metal-dependent hydrolase
MLQQAGHTVEWVARPDQVEAADVRRRAPREPQAGRGAGYLRRLTQDQPAAVVVDLASEGPPWADWIAAQKGSPATRRIPAIGLLPDSATEPQGMGFDRLVPYADLARLPTVVAEVARCVDHEGLARDCTGALSALGREGVRIFNRGAYFDAHEILEHAWNEDRGPARELYRGLLQIAVAYLQIERGNYNGALKMFLRMRQWLDPLPDTCRGVDVAAARRAALAAQAALEALGPARIADFDRTLFKPILIHDDVHP